MSNLTARFVVKRCEVYKTEASTVIRAFLVPQMPDYGGDEDGDPVSDLIFDVQYEAIPADFEFVDFKDAKTGEGNESGVWLIVPEEIAAGTVVDLQLSIVGVSA